MTDAVKYHISPKTGRPNLCDAKPGNCPLKNSDGTDPEHYADKPTARAAYEVFMQEEAFGTVSKKKNPVEVEDDFQPDPEEDRYYDVSEENYEEAKKRIERANRRLVKAGINDQFELTAEPYSKIVTEKGMTYQVDRVKLKINRPTISYDGFKFLARVEQLENGEFIASSSPGEELNGWTPTSMNCEHCGKIRDRSKVYVVQDKDGNYKTVGGSCVRLYTGLKPESLWALEWDDVEDLDDKNWSLGGGGSHGKPVAATADILSVADVVVRKWSYRPASFENSTKDVINRVLFPTSRKEDQDFANSIRAEAKSVDPEKVRESIQQALEGSNSDWAENVKKASRQEYIPTKYIAVLASGMTAVVKREEKAKETSLWNNKFIGNVGDKVKDLEAEVIGVTTDKVYYGYNPTYETKIDIRTATGEKIFVKTSSENVPEEGEKIILGGTVKSHDTWKNPNNEKDVRNSTRLLRIKWSLDPAQEKHNADVREAREAKEKARYENRWG